MKLRIQRTKARDDTTVKYLLKKEGVTIGTIPFHLMWGKTYNIHLALEENELTTKQAETTVLTAMRMLKEQVGAEKIIAWIPPDNKAACYGVVRIGFKRIHSNSDLNFYEYTLE